MPEMVFCHMENRPNSIHSIMSGKDGTVSSLDPSRRADCCAGKGGRLEFPKVEFHPALLWLLAKTVAPRG